MLLVLKGNHLLYQGKDLEISGFQYFIYLSVRERERVHERT